MSYQDGLRATFGLYAFARVVHQIRVDVDHAALYVAGAAFGRKSYALPRKPFQGSVCAYVYHGVRLEVVAEPSVECQVLMGREQFGVMVYPVGLFGP